ncbi:hypothetical protein [Salinispora arenicola]|uniref:hypothetical protein n=1 Tax=Salinispora arenicola TaxID=168697 RepID=UPI00035FA7A6|nr:hypothetical protein [Salinispora arenicola]NIL55655.1 hypothetical protein [Salinispora arenicola]NIL64030.1 hypothetical protein [Salinispora arenicola]
MAPATVACSVFDQSQSVRVPFSIWMPCAATSIPTWKITPRTIATIAFHKDDRIVRTVAWVAVIIPGMAAVEAPKVAVAIASA